MYSLFLNPVWTDQRKNFEIRWPVDFECRRDMAASEPLGLCAETAGH